jgi:hypothetical protein
MFLPKMIGNHDCGSRKGIHSLPQCSIVSCVKLCEHNTNPHVTIMHVFERSNCLSNENGQLIIEYKHVVQI